MNNTPATFNKMTLPVSSTPPPLEVNQDLRAGLENMTPLQRQRRTALLTDSPERPTAARTLRIKKPPHSPFESSSSSSSDSSSGSISISSESSDSYKCCSNYCCCCCHRKTMCCCSLGYKWRWCRGCQFFFKKYFQQIGRSVVWKGILLGQLIALLLCTMAILVSILVDNYSIKIASGLSLGTYVLMGAIFLSKHIASKDRKPISTTIRKKGIRYLFLSIIDVQFNYLINKSFQYTTLTSIQLLDCFSVPTVLVLSWTVLKTRYKLTHIGGLALGLMSVVTFVWVDVEDGKGGVNGGGRSRLLGDMLTLVGSLLSGISISGLDHAVHSRELFEFLGTKGLFGSIITAGQMSILEIEEIRGIRWELWEVSVLLVAYTIAQFAYYASLSYMLKISSSAGVNLSLLSTDFYAIMAGVLFFNYKFNPLYVLSIIFVLLGQIVFNIEPVECGSVIVRGKAEKYKKTSSSSLTPRTDVVTSGDILQLRSSASSSMRTSQTSFNSCTILYPSKRRNSCVLTSSAPIIHYPESKVEIHSLMRNGSTRSLSHNESI